MSLHKTYEVKQLGENRVLDIYLYDEIRANYRNLWGEIIESTTSAEYIRKALNKAGNVDNINIYINSCGGSVYEGVAIYNILKREKAFKTVYIDAIAYSVASVIAMVGDKVVMPSNTTMMIHHAMWGAYGFSKDLRKAADDLDKIDEASNNNYLTKAGNKITQAKLTELLDAETFLTANEAYEYGFCDEIIDPVNTESITEVLEQAHKANNPVAKKAFEFLQSTANNEEPPPTPPSNPEPTQIEDKYDWLSGFAKKQNLI